jgi:putative transposase
MSCGRCSFLEQTCYNVSVSDTLTFGPTGTIKTTRRTYKYRLCPTSRQARLLEHHLHLCRELYNAALQHRRDAYRMAGKSIGFAEQSAALVDCKAVRPDLAEVYSQTLQDVLHRVDRAFKAFFERVKRGDSPGSPGFPRFQGRDRYSSLTYPQSGWSLHNDSLTLSKVGTMKLKLHRPVCGKVKTVTIRRDGQHWYACFSVEYEFEPPAHQGEVVGIDVGLEHFANLSNGEQVENPRYFRKGEKRLAKAQRRLAKVVDGGEARHDPKRREYRKRVAAAHRKVRNQRADFLHKLSAQLARTYSLIVVEKLNIKGLAGGMLAKSVNDASWSAFLNMLRYKAEDAGAQLMEVDPRMTSQTCPGCGSVRKKELSDRWHSCIDCGMECHRDIAAALVILARGLASMGNQSLEPIRLQSA